MSPEENRDRTRTQGGSSVKQTAYEATLREGKFDLSALNKPGEFPVVSGSAARKAADWSSNEMNLRIKEQILTEHPMLCSWVQAPQNLEAAKGELRELSFWERLSNVNLKDEAIELGEGAWEFLAETRVTGDVIEFGKGTLGSGTKKLGTITEGLGQVIYAPPGPNDAPGEEGWLNFLSEGLQSFGETLQNAGEEKFRARDKFKDSWARQAGELIGDELPIVAVGAIPVAGRFLVPVVDGLANAGDSASNARIAGADENAQTSAARLSFLLGGFEVPVDGLIEGKDRKAGKGWRRLGAELLFKATWAGAKDIGKKIGQNAIAIDYYKPDQKLDDGVLKAGVNGVAKSVMLQAVPTLVPKAFAAISEHASSSKVRLLNPKEFGDYLGVVTRDTPIETIHIEGKKFSDIFRNDGDDTGKVFGSMPGFDQAQLKVAISSGGDVKLPLSTYATHLAGGKHDPALLPHMRFDPHAKTLAEWQALKASESERSARAKSDAEVARAAEDRNQTVAKQEHQQDVQRLQASGISPEQAQSGAVALDATRGVRSAKAGQTREDYSRENPPADASSINQGQPSSAKGAAGQAATGSINASESVSGSRTAASPPVSNDPSLKVERLGTAPVSTLPQMPLSTVPNQTMPAGELKATLQSSTAPAARLEPPALPPKIFNKQGPAVPTETPWSDRRKTLDRNGR